MHTRTSRGTSTQKGLMRYTKGHPAVHQRASHGTHKEGLPRQNAHKGLPRHTQKGIPRTIQGRVPQPFEPNMEPLRFPKLPAARPYVSAASAGLVWTGGRGPTAPAGTPSDPAPSLSSRATDPMTRVAGPPPCPRSFRRHPRDPACRAPRGHRGTLSCPGDNSEGARIRRQRDG